MDNITSFLENIWCLPKISILHWNRIQSQLLPIPQEDWVPLASALRSSCILSFADCSLATLLPLFFLTLSLFLLFWSWVLQRCIPSVWKAVLWGGGVGGLLSSPMAQLSRYFLKEAFPGHPVYRSLPMQYKAQIQFIPYNSPLITI